MRTTFAGWYSKTPEQIKALWEGAIIVPDTNILLHLMRHSVKVRGQLMDVFEQKKAALWIPYQIGAEFQRRRLDVQHQALEAYDKVSEGLTTFVNQAKNNLNAYRAHPVIEIDNELAALDMYAADFHERMANAKAAHPAEELAKSFVKVTELFEGRVGAKPPPERIVTIHKEGEERYAKKMPPGFEDTKKAAEGGDKFGDLVIWKEIIEKAKADKRPVIFVTDDGKADWWYIHRGKKIGPHPMLIEEFLALTGQEFHIYELLQFLRYAAETGSAIQADAVRQIEDTLIADSKAVALSSGAERARMIQAVRAELRDKESELDDLVKTLIEAPASGTEAAAPSVESRQTLKSRIAELTELVNAMGVRLTALEAGGAS